MIRRGYRDDPIRQELLNPVAAVLAAAEQLPSARSTTEELLNPAAAVRAPKPGLYWWFRSVDETGMSGKGFVAQVAVFEDGRAVMRWLKARNAAGVQSFTVYESVSDLIHVHGHGKKEVGSLVPVLSPGQPIKIHSMEGFGGLAEVISQEPQRVRVKPLDGHQPGDYWAWNHEIFER